MMPRISTATGLSGPSCAKVTMSSGRSRAVGRPKMEVTKEAVNLRLDADVVAYFRATGRGWQSRINDALRKLAGLSS